MQFAYTNTEKELSRGQTMEVNILQRMQVASTCKHRVMMAATG